jgi:uncharacterized zinc-type alcohol dehydrogenase-like protein
VGDFDVRFEMKYCGICHSDCHIGNNDLGGCTYPVVTGHELVGTVVEVGPKVTKFQVGDNVGVGCFVDACLECEYCKAGDEQYCNQKGGCTWTYNSPKVHGNYGGNPETITYGGYSGSNTVHERFVIKLPDGLPLEKAGPLMCAAITLYDPLKHWGALEKKNMTIGIIGIGGLGTMGIKLAKAMGQKVYAISTSANKEQMAKEKGADGFVVSTDPASMAANAASCDLIISTVSSAHEVAPYLSLLKTNGTIVELGLVTQPHTVSQLPLVFQRKSIAGSLIGGIANTEECIEFCFKNNVLPDVQLIEAKEIDWAWNQLLTINKDGIRYVIDIKKSLANPEFLPPQE